MPGQVGHQRVDDPGMSAVAADPRDDIEGACLVEQRGELRLKGAMFGREQFILHA